jgi:hypothetical protein
MKEKNKLVFKSYAIIGLFYNFTEQRSAQFYTEVEFEMLAEGVHRQG